MNPVVGLDVSKGESRFKHFWKKENHFEKLLKSLILFKVLVYL
jgi:hypothetical protein